MKPHSHFQPTCITDQDKHIFRVWEQHYLSSLVTRSFLLCFPTGGVLGSSRTLLHLPLPRLSSSVCWVSTAAGPSQNGLGAAESSNPTLHPTPLGAAAASRAFAWLGAEPNAALLNLQPPSPTLPLFLTRVGVSIHPVASFFRQ